MRVETYLDRDIPITVSISSEDIRCCLREDTDSEKTVMSCLNDFAGFLKAIPDEIIINLNDAQKDAIRKFLTAEALRYCQ